MHFFRLFFDTSFYLYFSDFTLTLSVFRFSFLYYSQKLTKKLLMIFLPREVFYPNIFISFSSCLKKYLLFDLNFAGVKRFACFINKSILSKSSKANI